MVCMSIRAMGLRSRAGLGAIGGRRLEKVRREGGSGVGGGVHDSGYSTHADAL